MILTTPRCQICSFSEAYIQSALPLFTNEQVRAFLGGPVPADWAEKRLERWATEKSDSQYFAVTLLDGTFIGFIDISPYHEPEYQELSYLFLPEFWGYGYAFEACRAVLRYCEETLDLKTLVAETQSANTRSRALLERLGFTMKQQIERFGAMQCVYERTQNISRRTHNMDQCIFCKLLNGHTAKMVYEDDFTAAFMDIAGDVDGHILVVPKKHTKSILNADEITLSRVMSTVQKVSRHLVDDCGYEGVNLVNASGECAGQSVPHLHIHIIPRKRQDGIDAWPKLNGATQSVEAAYEKLKMMD